MRIGIDVSQAQYQGTGVGTYTNNIVHHLVRMFPEHEFVLFGTSFRGLTSLKNLFADVAVTKRFYPLNAKMLDWLFNKKNLISIETLIGTVDVFHASDWTQPSSRQAQLVTTIHDLTTLKYPEHQHQTIIATHQRRLERIKQFDVTVIADSAATKKDVIRLLEIDEGKITVVHLAASTDFVTFSQLGRLEKQEKITSVKAKYKLDNYVLSVGTNEPRKNLSRVIEAFADINKRQYRNLKLAIAGKYGWGESGISELSSGVTALGYVDQSDLPALYAGSQAFIYPSLYEGFGLPVLEAMTLGVPTVTSRRGSLAEVAGYAAVVVEPNSTSAIGGGIVNALTHAKKYRDLGIKQASKFSWEKAARETMQVYESLVG